MSARRPFVVLTPTDHEYVHAKGVADALERTRLPRGEAAAVLDEATLINCRRALSEVRPAPFVVIIGRVPAAGSIQTPSNK